LLHLLSLGAGLLAFWLLLSGIFTPLLIGFALFSCALVLWVARRMDLVDHEWHPMNLRIGRTLRYLVWLYAEIVKANLDVARRIVARNLAIAPRLVRIRPSQRTDLGRAIHANSITLTPGTVSVKVAEGEFLVHALSEAAAADLVAGAIDRRVSLLERQR